jgi:hypothetical protein
MYLDDAGTVTDTDVDPDILNEQLYAPTIDFTPSGGTLETRPDTADMRTIPDGASAQVLGTIPSLPPSERSLETIPSDHTPSIPPSPEVERRHRLGSWLMLERPSTATLVPAYGNGHTDLSGRISEGDGESMRSLGGVPEIPDEEISHMRLSSRYSTFPAPVLDDRQSPRAEGNHMPINKSSSATSSRSSSPAMSNGTFGPRTTHSPQISTSGYSAGLPQPRAHL